MWKYPRPKHVTLLMNIFPKMFCRSVYMSICLIVSLSFCPSVYMEISVISQPIHASNPTMKYIALIFLFFIIFPSLFVSSDLPHSRMFFFVRPSPFLFLVFLSDFLYRPSSQACHAPPELRFTCFYSRFPCRLFNKSLN